MRRGVKTIFLLVAMLLLAACSEDNWFNHTVKYNGKTDKPEMVVTAELEAGKTPLIYVSESVFFLDPKHDVMDTTWINGERRTTKTLRASYLRDAEVKMSVNGAAPVTLRGEELNHFYIGQYGDTVLKKQFVYTADYVLQPSDNLAFMVTHSRYPKDVQVTQQVPARVGATVDYRGIEVKDERNSLASFEVELAPYTGNETDMLCFRTQVYQTRIRTSRYYDRTKHAYQTRSYAGKQEWRYIYSPDLSFAACDKTNKELSGGYYGADYSGLFRAVNRAAERLPISVYVRTCQALCNNYEDANNWDSTYVTLDSIRLEVVAVTRDAYLHTASLFAGGYLSKYVPNLFGSQSGGNIVDNIGDIFDEMGSMEGIQIYSNMENAIGCVSASAAQSFIYRPALNQEY